MNRSSSCHFEAGLFETCVKERLTPVLDRQHPGAKFWRKPGQQVQLLPYDAQQGPYTSASVKEINKDTFGSPLANDLNIRFRHGDNDKMNALFCDGHVDTFSTSAHLLNPVITNPPLAGNLLCKNINLDQP